jgi:hypothetical protein
MPTDAEQEIERSEEEEREARKEVVDVLKAELAIEQNRTKWLMRVIVVWAGLIFVMFGVAVGVVRAGSVNIPLIGEVVVGDDPVNKERVSTDDEVGGGPVEQGEADHDTEPGVPLVPDQ